MNRKIRLSMIFTGLVLVVACAGRTPSSVVQAFYKAVANGDSDTAIGLLSQKTIASVSREKLKAGLQEASRNVLKKGGLTEVQITNERTAGEVASVSMILKYGNGEQEMEELDLVKEDDSWKIEPKK